MSQIEQRLRALGIELPSPPAPVASYVPFTVSGRLVFVSGQIPIAEGKPQFIGKLAAEISLEDGKKAARLCALNLLAQLKAACSGDLDRVKNCLRLGVFVSAVPDFTQHPEIANGASDFIVEAMGDAGKHARAAVGAGSLPRGVAVEVEGLFEID
jgi:enamine deaminase RidA (YjgF/YER057c/UK114 family)